MVLKLQAGARWNDDEIGNGISDAVLVDSHLEVRDSGAPSTGASRGVLRLESTDECERVLLADHCAT